MTLPEGARLVTVPDGAGGQRPVTDDDIAACAAEGHVPTVGLRHSEARMQMVADCTRCGAELALNQTPEAGR